MKFHLLFLLAAIALAGCKEAYEPSSMNTENWAKRAATLPSVDSLEYGKSYLSIYSQVYSMTEHKTHNLTAMVSLRNPSAKDTVYLLSAEYFDTHGKPIRTYFDNPIYLAPLETTEIIIDERDVAGGTGANFIIEWKISTGTPEPIFEGVMISTKGQQGLSFTTQATRIE